MRLRANIHKLFNLKRGRCGGYATSSRRLPTRMHPARARASCAPRPPPPRAACRSASAPSAARSAAREKLGRARGRRRRRRQNCRVSSRLSTSHLPYKARYFGQHVLRAAACVMALNGVSLSRSAEVADQRPAQCQARNNASGRSTPERASITHRHPLSTRDDCGSATLRNPPLTTPQKHHASAAAARARPCRTLSEAEEAQRWPACALCRPPPLLRRPCSPRTGASALRCRRRAPRYAAGPGARQGAPARLGKQ